MRTTQNSGPLRHARSTLPLFLLPSVPPVGNPTRRVRRAGVRGAPRPRVDQMRSEIHGHSTKCHHGKCTTIAVHQCPVSPRAIVDRAVRASPFSGRVDPSRQMRPPVRVDGALLSAESSE